MKINLVRQKISSRRLISLVNSDDILESNELIKKASELTVAINQASQYQIVGQTIYCEFITSTNNYKGPSFEVIGVPKANLNLKFLDLREKNLLKYEIWAGESFEVDLNEIFLNSKALIRTLESKLKAKNSFIAILPHKIELHFFE